MSSHILVLTQLFYPELISSGQTVTELCEAMSDDGVRINVWCAPPTLIDRDTPIPKTMTHKGICIRRCWSTRFPKLYLFGRLLNHLTFAFSVCLRLLWERPKYPILVFTNPPFLAWIVALYSICFKCRFVYVVFDVYPNTAEVLGVMKKNGWVARIWRKLNAIVYRSAASVVVLGRCMESILQQSISTPLPSLERVHVWADDQNIMAYKTTADRPWTFRQKWKLEDACIVLYSGNMGQFHDIETLLKGAHRLQHRQDIAFVFVGEGAKKSMLIDYVNQHELANVHIHSYVDRSNLAHLLSSANIGLVSLVPEQVGLSVPSKTYGLMAAGCPVVAVMPDHAEIAQVINEESCGIVVNNNDISTFSETIEYLADSKATRHSLGKAGQHAIQQNYTVKAAAKKYRQLLFS